LGARFLGIAWDLKDAACYSYICMIVGRVCNDPSVEAQKLMVKAKGRHRPLQHDTPESAANGAVSANAAVVVRPIIPQSVLILFY
jgi:hypothetical protein